MIKLPEIKLVLSHLVVFLLGGLSVFSYVYTHPDTGHHNVRPHHGETEDQIRVYLTDKLHLTPDQVTKLQPILTDTGYQMEAIRKTMRSQAEAVLSSSSTKISAILTPDQQKVFNQLQAEQKAHPHF